MHDNQVEHDNIDQEGHMAKAELYKAAKTAIKLFELLDDNQQLDAWVQAKITKAADYLDGVYHYLEYELKYAGEKPHGDIEDLAGDHRHDVSLDDEHIDLSGIDESTTYEDKLAQLLESAQVDEVNTGTLVRYASKAKKDALKAGIAGSRAKDMGDDEEWAKQRNKEEKRDKGIATAQHKLKKKFSSPSVEESDQVDEVSLKAVGKALKTAAKTAPYIPAAVGVATGMHMSNELDKQKAHKEPTKLVKAAAKSDAKTVDLKNPKLVKPTKVAKVGEAKAASPITGTRKITSFVGDHGHTAEVRFSPEYSEYQVHHYKDGKHVGEKSVSYHGDKQDAIDTAKFETGVAEAVQESVVTTKAPLMESVELGIIKKLSGL